MIVTPDDTAIAQAASLLKAGGLVAFPTETVYGLGAYALDPSAVARIFEAKERPFFDPLIVHVSETTNLSLIVREFPEIAQKLVDAFWPGPLTMVLPKSPSIPDIVTAGLDTVAVRMPSHPVARKLLAHAGIPVAAPSANRFGMLSPTCAEHVYAQLHGKADLILNGGPCAVGIESTIVKIDADAVIVLRFGGIPIEEIERIAGTLTIADSSAIEAPGQLPSHYAPRTPLYIVKNEDEVPAGDDVCFLAFRNQPKRKFKAVEILSPQGDLREAAAHLFASLHHLDSSGARAIFAEEVPQIGLGLAIMDRLRKASKKTLD